MSSLWIGISLLTLLALAFVFLPLVRARRAQLAEQVEDRRQQNIDIFRERLAELQQELDSGNLAQAEFEQLKLELEKNLLHDAEALPLQAKVQLDGRQLITVLLLALILPTAAFGLYAKLGRFDDLMVAQQLAEDPFDGRQPTLEEALAQLEQELAARPDNAEGWYMLASTYLGMGRYADGAEALSKVVALLPQDAPQYPGVMGQYAQALYFAADGQMTDQIRKQIDQVLAIDPFEVTTLGLLGIDAFEQQQYEAAIDYWRKALDRAEGKAAESLRTGIGKAREALIAQGKPAPELPELAPVQIRVSVALAETLRDKVSAEDTVFVFARPVGGRMPLAALKLTVAELPAEVVLDDSLAMMPEAKLSSVQQVEVTAKVSASGQPQQQPGDLYGSRSPVQVGGENQVVELLIDKVVE
ncbi:c-type cytochrome biogenesis protein CcmI [Marinobacterium arenosum]|uniref:c-type cytochrome biogenesis protein CcmI n=1 Tax=Marinobacterium arenosum TaxID=2862496 RepID=UPI001C938C1D|nr:c-type cytochrome biogenesis protein CcmI [Marinobacterium arenosum]MBY4675982.1 c-type cytochrome biogenesis protein CcmI [Marinobacterium arenosum]